MTAIRSASAATTPRSCVTISSAIPNSLHREASSAMISACTVTSSAVVGSSANRMRGFAIRPSAIATRCRIPPESSCGYCASSRPAPGSRTRPSMATASSSATLRRTPLAVIVTSASWSPIDRCGVRLPDASWNTKPMPRPRTLPVACASPSSSRPSKRTDPPALPLAASRPVQARSSWLLPEPDSPTIARRSRGATARSTPSTARIAGSPVKSTRSPRTSRSALTGPSDRGRRAGCRPGS
jgi:hypothetical protein